MWMHFRLLRQLTILISIACLFAYFIYHMIEGDRGLKARTRLTQELQETQAHLKSLETERASLENHVNLMSNHLDHDLLDQQVRLFLDYVHPNDVVIFW